MRNGILSLVVFFSLSFVHNAFSQKTEPVKKKAGLKRTSEQNAVPEDLQMTVGLQTTVDLPFKVCQPLNDCIKVTNIGLFVQAPQYAAEKNQLIFSPQKRGETTVTIRDENGDIGLIIHAVINENNLSRRVMELRELLRDIEGIDFKIMGDKIVVDGEVVVMNDLNRLYTVLSDPSYNTLVLNLVTVSPVGMQVMAERIQAEINNQNVKVRILGNRFVVEGVVDTAIEAESVLRIAKNMVQGFTKPLFAYEGLKPIEVLKEPDKDPIVNRLRIKAAPPQPIAKLVRITVDFVELSKDYLRNFGFSWAPSMDTGGSIDFGQSTTGGVTTQGSGSLAGTISNLFPKLQTLQNAGYARILEETVLLVKSGEQASFKRQLDIPIQTTNERGQPTFVKQAVGPQMNLRPTVSGENIDMRIEFAYAGLAGRQGNAPLILNHNYNGSLIIKNGQSAALVNAISNAISTSFNRDAPGGGTPTNSLFTLLRSKAFQKSKSQFVIFLTPQVIESASTGTEDIKTKYGLKRKK